MYITADEKGVRSMNHSEISSFIWGTADLLRSSFKQHEYGDIILPFTVMRRLDVVLEPTKQAVLEAAAKPLPEALRDTMLKQAAGVDFYNTSEFTMSSLLNDADGIRENLTKFVTSFSPEIADIFDKFKIFEVIKDLDDNDLLFLVVERFCSPKIDLSPASVSNADMGDIYEELIRRFSEVSNETAGEHFSPRDGLKLAARLLVIGEMDDLTQPNRIVKVCDPCAGTGGALTVFADCVHEVNPAATVVTYAQEINGQSYAICKSDTILKGGNVANVHLGDTLADDQMPDETFGYQISNPPYGVDWKKSKAAVTKEHDERGFAGRFGAGLPRISDGQLLFVQHMVAKMRASEDGGGRIAVFLNGSPLFTGAAGSGESEIRRYSWSTIWWTPSLPCPTISSSIRASLPTSGCSTTPRNPAGAARCSSSTPTASIPRCARAWVANATSSPTSRSSRLLGCTRRSRMPIPNFPRFLPPRSSAM